MWCKIAVAKAPRNKVPEMMKHLNTAFQEGSKLFLEGVWHVISVCIPDGGGEKGCMILKNEKK